MKPTMLLLGGLTLGLLLGFLIWETSRGGPLRVENLRLIEQAKTADALRAENARLTGERADPDELKKLRDGQTELLRLRGQVSQLRREAQAAHATTRPIAEAVPTNAVPDESPVDSFTASVTKTVGWKQALVTGGWRLPSGKRAFVLMQPSADQGEGTVLLRSQIVEMSDSAVAALGFQAWLTEERASSGGLVLSVEQAGILQANLKQMEGVDIISSPSVTTASGRQAQVSVVDVRTLPSGETYHTGPTVDITPTISADKQNVELVVNAQLNLPRVKK